jgi:hypothetical protein
MNFDRSHPCRLREFAGAVVSLLAVVPAAGAQTWTPLGSEFQVNSSTVGHQTNPEIAADAAGNFVVVWDGEGLGDEVGILGQRYFSDGSPAAAEFWANVTTVGAQQRPSVGSADNGDFVIVWDDAMASGAQDVWAQRFSSSGVRVGSNFRVNETLEPAQYASDIAVLPDGRFVITWSARVLPAARARGAWTNAEVIARRFAADGAPLGAEFQVNTFTPDQDNSPAISTTSDGGFVVAWDRNAEDGDSWEIRGQRFNPVGGKVGAEFQVNSYTTGLRYGPSIAALADDAFVVVWSSRDQDGDGRGVYGQRFGPTGIPAGGEFQVNTYTTGPQGEATVLAASGGGFVVAWEGPEVHAKRYQSDGNPVGGEYVLNSYLTALQGSPALSGDPDGDFVATWMSFGQDGDGQGIFAQRFAGFIFMDGFESGDLSKWSSSNP